jgi:hypothetical protein
MSNDNVDCSVMLTVPRDGIDGFGSNWHDKETGTVTCLRFD